RSSVARTQNDNTILPRRVACVNKPDDAIHRSLFVVRIFQAGWTPGCPQGCAAARNCATLISDGGRTTMLYRSSIGAIALLVALNATLAGGQAQEASKYPDWKGAWSR